MLSHSVSSTMLLLASSKAAAPSASAFLPAICSLSQHLHHQAAQAGIAGMPAATAPPRHLTPRAFPSLHTPSKPAFQRVSLPHLQPSTSFSRYQSTIKAALPPNPFEGKDVDVLNHAYDKEFMEAVKPTHQPPTKLYHKVGFNTVQLARRFFDWLSGYGPDMTEAKWMQRFIFLETVAGVPGMCAGMLRHLKSLRSMEHDNGWITHLLDEAENERMHLLTFLKLRNPGFLFRGSVILAQGVFFNAYFVAYLLSPRTCHSFVGYLEEEAVKTYTHALEDIDGGCLQHWQTQPAPEIAIHYWKLKPEATMRDLIMAVRADEAGHSHVNHKLSNISQDQVNPFVHDSKMLM